MKHYKIETLLFSILLLAVGACGRSSDNQEQQMPERIPVRLMTLEVQAKAPVLTVSGRFTTDDETLLSFKHGGVLKALWVKEGDPVKKGQLLASLDPTEIDAATQQAILAYEKAERDYKRIQGLYQDSVATLEQLENTKTMRDVSKQQLDAARFNQEFTEIRATMHGYVLQRYAQVGQVLGPGTPVLRINGAGEGAWQVKVGLSDQEWAAVQIGDSARIYSTLLPEEGTSAYVSHKSEGVDAQTGLFTVHLSLRESLGSALASGAFARAEIQASRLVQTWKIPYDALLDGDQGKGYVFITRDRKTAEKVEIELSTVHRDYVEVTAGLEDVPYLIISGSAYLDAGTSIDIVSDSSNNKEEE